MLICRHRKRSLLGCQANNFNRTIYSSCFGLITFIRANAVILRSLFCLLIARRFHVVKESENRETGKIHQRLEQQHHHLVRICSHLLIRKEYIRTRGDVDRYSAVKNCNDQEQRKISRDIPLPRLRYRKRILVTVSLSFFFLHPLKEKRKQESSQQQKTTTTMTTTTATPTMATILHLHAFFFLFPPRRRRTRFCWQIESMPDTRPVFLVLPGMLLRIVPLVSLLFFFLPSKIKTEFYLWTSLDDPHVMTSWDQHMHQQITTRLITVLLSKNRFGSWKAISSNTRKRTFKTWCDNDWLPHTQCEVRFHISSSTSDHIDCDPHWSFLLRIQAVLYLSLYTSWGRELFKRIGRTVTHRSQRIICTWLSLIVVSSLFRSADVCIGR